MKNSIIQKMVSGVMLSLCLVPVVAVAKSYDIAGPPAKVFFKEPLPKRLCSDRDAARGYHVFPSNWGPYFQAQIKILGRPTDSHAYQGRFTPHNRNWGKVWVKVVEVLQGEVPRYRFHLYVPAAWKRIPKDSVGKSYYILGRVIKRKPDQVQAMNGKIAAIALSERILADTARGECFNEKVTYTWHQKMIVEVEADGKVYAGSSVVKMLVTSIPKKLRYEKEREIGLRGEAVVLALPNHRFLFVPLTYNAFLASRVFRDKMKGAVLEAGERWASIIRNLRESRKMSPRDYPMLVTFSDINDPKTVVKIDPANLAATFGSGVSLKRITLEITDEPVTEGKIGPVLKWLDTVGDGMLDGRAISTIRAENRLANDLSRLDFRR